jgi:hypothetical protein
MPTATLSRGGTSVTMKIWREGGQLAIAVDAGKLSATTYEVAAEDPKTADHKSALHRITVLGVLLGSNAYSNAQTLCESLVKPHSDGTPLTLDVTSVPGFTTGYEVGVPDSRAVQVDYRAGITNRVDVQLGLPVVSSTIG